ncbi:hypothetical protein [Bacteroides finegoldii]|jgi:hypothetical protein|uniref:hypothetical protein n=1 Tax=Bacteroides finegoldii TaxID=338188 RepID=UPI0018A0780A|nr:hypothetical protein [Bacteroides finegoldii]
MAKKNLTLLMDGFIGEAQTSSATQQQSIQGKCVAQEEIQDAKSQNDELSHVKETPSAETGTPEQMKSRLEVKRKENVGRPKKGEAAKNAKKPQEVRATFIVDADLLRKVKYISLVEGLLLKDVIAEALNAYVNKWEEVNRKIRLPKVK